MNLFTVDKGFDISDKLHKTKRISYYIDGHTLVLLNFEYRVNKIGIVTTGNSSKMMTMAPNIHWQ